MGDPSTPVTLSPAAARQLELLAQALIGVAEEELLASSLRQEGRATTPAAGYPTRLDDERPGGEEVFPGATAH